MTQSYADKWRYVQSFLAELNSKYPIEQVNLFLRYYVECGMLTMHHETEIVDDGWIIAGEFVKNEWKE